MLELENWWVTKQISISGFSCDDVDADYGGKMQQQENMQVAAPNFANNQVRFVFYAVEGEDICISK